MMNLKKAAAAVLAAVTIMSCTFNADAYEYYDDIVEEIAVEEEAVPADEYTGDFFFDFFFDEASDFANKEKISFSTKKSPKLKAKQVSSGIKIYWGRVEGCDGYRIYRYDSKKKKYVKIDEVSSEYTTSYFDYDVESLTKYSYKIKAFRKSGGKVQLTKLSNAASAKTSLMPVNLNVAAKSKTISLTWAKSSSVDGYEIYYAKEKIKKSDTLTLQSYPNMYYEYTNSTYTLPKFKLLKKTKDNSFSIKKDPAYRYYFKMRTYKKVNGKTMYSEFTYPVSTTSGVAEVNGYKATPRSSFKVVSYRSDIKGWTMNISEKDKKIMKKFADEHFTSKMSPYDKIKYVADYIYSEVDYAEGSDYNSISGLSCVEAIFVKHKGQCYQYNGAFASFLSYMGYDVRLIAGYRGWSNSDKWSHYWCEIKLNGKYYVMDAGNKSSGLYFIFTPYECTQKYLKNGKTISKSPTK